MSLLEAYVLFVLPTLFLAVCAGVLIWTRHLQRRRKRPRDEAWHPLGLDGDGI